MPYILLSADFFSKLTFSKILSGTLSECQTVRIQIRTDILSALIWVGNVCKSYQQTTKVAARKERECLFQLREVYSYSLEKNIFEQEAYTHSMELLK